MGGGVMSCIQCKRDITGEFVVLGVLGGILDATDSSTQLPTLKPDCMFDITIHSDEQEVYKTVNLFDQMQQHDSSSEMMGQWAMQAESYFCSQQCLKEWFCAKVDACPDYLRGRVSG